MMFSIIHLAIALSLSFPLLSSSAPLKLRRSKTISPRQSPSRSFTLAETIAGESFFDAFDFFTDADPTHGAVNYVSQDTAQAKGLAGVTNGLARIAVDSTSTLEMGNNRDSVRISTKNTYSKGLFIYNVTHMPTGLTTWPAVWSTDGANWPNNGEIDLIEGVHESQNNQVTMHTNGGCSLATGQAITGTVIGTTCDSTVTNNGCATTDPNGWGTEFNAAGGGVFVKVWDPDYGIEVFHFPQDKVPDDITSKCPDPTSWGNPVSFIPNGDLCNIGEHFQNHQIIINITLCGDWAGASYSGPGTCQSAMDPTNYKDAYWEIGSIEVYQSSPA